MDDSIILELVRGLRSDIQGLRSDLTILLEKHDVRLDRLEAKYTLFLGGWAALTGLTTMAVAVYKLIP